MTNERQANFFLVEQVEARACSWGAPSRCVRKPKAPSLNYAWITQMVVLVVEVFVVLNIIGGKL